MAPRQINRFCLGALLGVPFALAQEPVRELNVCMVIDLQHSVPFREASTTYVELQTTLRPYGYEVRGSVIMRPVSLENSHFGDEISSYCKNADLGIVFTTRAPPPHARSTDSVRDKKHKQHKRPPIAGIAYTEKHYCVIYNRTHDIATIAKHEIFHLLGVPHDNEPNSLMQPEYSQTHRKIYPVHETIISAQKQHQWWRPPQYRIGYNHRKH